MARKAKEIIWPHLNDCNGDVTKKWYVEFSVRNIQTGEMVRDKEFNIIVNIPHGKQIYAELARETQSEMAARAEYTIKSGTSVEISIDSTVPESYGRVSLVHEAFSRLSEIITAEGNYPGLTVKSDWYGRMNTDVNYTPYGTVGGGALKAILNGYELRKATFPEQQEPKGIELSFKELFELLNAIDNIGWGFSEENGKLYVRVERWWWFYKDDVIMTVHNPNNVKRATQPDRIYARLKTGYSKHLDEKEINAIDTFHTEREYSTGLKATKNSIEKLCKFIADPYAIEDAEATV